MKQFPSKRKPMLGAKKEKAVKPAAKPVKAKAAPKLKKVEKAYAKPKAVKIETDVSESGTIEIHSSQLNLGFVHYTQTNKKTIQVYVLPQVVKSFFDVYKADLQYDPDLKVFTGPMPSDVSDSKEFTFIKYENRPVSADAQKKTSEIRENLCALDSQIESIKTEQSAMRAEAIDLVLQHGVSTKKGRAYHKKMLTGNWTTSVRQLLPEIEMKTPNASDIEDLIENHPKHKKLLSKLLDGNCNCYEISAEEENLLALVKKLAKYNLRNLKIQFMTSDKVDESELGSCHSWPSMDVDIEKFDKMVNDLPFEVKLDLYSLPDEDDLNIQFHYKTDQKTDPECPYCGDEFVKHTNKCKSCGLTAPKK